MDWFVRCGCYAWTRDAWQLALGVSMLQHRGMNRVNCSESLKFPVLTPLVSVNWAT